MVDESPVEQHSSGGRLVDKAGEIAVMNDGSCSVHCSLAYSNNVERQAR